VGRPAIVHLIGFPGVGKFTIARDVGRLARESGDHFVVLDNHLTSNVIFAVLDVDGVQPLPRTVWDRVGEVRDAVYRAIEELSPTDWSFVFTNVLTQDQPDDVAAPDRLARLAEARGGPYIPVRLHCDVDEMRQRIVNEDRRPRMKWVDPDAVLSFAEGRELVRLSGREPLDLDVTTVDPAAAAAWILERVESRRS
jgi:aminoglycoside 6'-N-acetyltransferase